MDQLENLSIYTLQDIFQKIQYIPRNGDGQLYIVQGLQSSLHFSLGPNGMMYLINFASKNNLCQSKVSGRVNIKLYNNQNKMYNSSIDDHIYVKNADPYNLSMFENEYIKGMNKLAVLLLPILYKVRFNYKLI